MNVPVRGENARVPRPDGSERAQSRGVPLPHTIVLQHQPPFDADAALGNLRAHAIPGAEVVTGNSIRRLLLAPSGPLAVTVTLTADGVSAVIDDTVDSALDDAPADGSGSARVSPADVAAVTETLRRWFDLDLDPGRVSAALGGDTVVGPLVAARPGLRVIGSPHAFETAVMTVLGQQVSLARARALGGLAVAEFGRPSAGGLALFPRADALASVPVHELRAALRLTGARAEAVHALAEACAGGLELSAEADPQEFRSGLLSLPGIGPWTVEYLAVRVLGDRDAFTASDLVLRRALGGVSVREAESASEAWRPYRAYALFHLWTATSY